MSKMDIDQKLKRFYKSLSPAQRNELMREVLGEIEQEKQVEEKQTYLSEDGIVTFCRYKVGIDLAPYQERILKALVRYKRVAVRGPHGLGKTTIAALFVLWLMYVYEDVKIPTLAPTHRQTGFIWSEIRKRVSSVKEKDYRVLQRALKGKDKEAFAVASDDPALIEGVHAQVVAYIFDEAKSIGPEFFEAAEGAYANAGEDTDFEAYWLVISTPFIEEGEFYDIHARKPGYQDWHTIHVTLAECIEAGRISAEWAEKRKAQWGEDNPVYQNRVLGEFATQAENALIPLAWVEKAHERYLEMKSTPRTGNRALGVDPADGGPDKSAIAEKIGRMVEISYHQQKDTMALAGLVASKLALQKETPVAVDIIGIGAGVGSRLDELGFNIRKTNVGESAKDEHGQVLKDILTQTFEFVNLRSFIWWLIRDSLNPMNPDAIALNPADDLLTGDLVTPQFFYRSDGKIQVESKLDIRKRIKRSTDSADALGLALFADFMAYHAPEQAREYKKLVYKNTHNKRLNARRNFENYLSSSQGQYPQHQNPNRPEGIVISRKSGKTRLS